MVLKMTSDLRLGDPETQIKALGAQMLFLRGFDVVCGNIFIGTLTKMVL